MTQTNIAHLKANLTLAVKVEPGARPKEVTDKLARVDDMLNRVPTEYLEQAWANIEAARVSATQPATAEVQPSATTDQPPVLAEQPTGPEEIDGYTYLVSARNSWFNKDGLPGKERGELIDKQLGRAGGVLRRAATAVLDANPTLMKGLTHGRKFLKELRDDFCQGLDDRTINQAMETLNGVGTQDNRAEVITALVENNQFRQSVRSDNGRQFSFNEFFRRLHERGTSFTPENVGAGITQLAADTRLMVQYEDSLPGGCSEDLARSYFARERTAESDTLFTNNHQALDRIRRTSPQAFGQIFELNQQGLTQETQIVLGGAGLNQEALEGLTGSLLTLSEQQRQFVQQSNLEEWGHITGSNERTSGLVADISNDRFEFSDFRLATGYLGTADGSHIDAYMDSEIVGADQLQGLRALTPTVRADQPPRAGVVGSLESLTGMAPTTTPPDVEADFNQRVGQGVDAVTDMVAQFFDGYNTAANANLGESAFSDLIELSEHNRNAREFFASPTCVQLMQDNILPAVRRAQDSFIQTYPGPDSRRTQPDIPFMQEHFRHILRHANADNLLMYTHQGRIDNAVQLTQVMMRGFNNLGVQMPSDTQTNPRRMMWNLLLTHPREYDELTTGSFHRTMEDTLSHQHRDRVIDQGLNPQLYYRAIGRCPEVTSLIASPEGMAEIVRLNTWSDQHGTSYRLADE